MKPVTPTIIDIEASGFGAASYPIEVGVKRGDGERFCRLIKPAPDWTHWDEKAARLHGIERAELERYGSDPVSVCHDLNQFIGGQQVYTDGWVVDYPWLIKLFETARVDMAFKVSALDYLLSEQQMESWSHVRAGLHEEHRGQRHRASADAELIQLTFIRSAKQSSVHGKP